MTTFGCRVTPSAFCVIGADVEIADGVTLHPNVVIYPRTKIGARTIIHAGAIIREACTIGSDVVIQSGSVIGGEGFGYLPDKLQGLIHVPHIGKVSISSGVEIGANSCIDRAALGVTAIGTGVKIDNLVQVGHNGKVGDFSLLCGQVGLAGSVTLGSGVVMGGKSGAKDHVTVANNVRVAGSSMVTRDIKESGDYGGYPAIKAANFRRQLVMLEKMGNKPE